MRDDLRTYVVDHLGQQDAILAIDETGFLKRELIRQVCSVNTAALRAELRTAKLACSWRM